MGGCPGTIMLQPPQKAASQQRVRSLSTLTSGTAGRAPVAPDSSMRQPFSLSFYSRYNCLLGAGTSTGTSVMPWRG